MASISPSYVAKRVLWALVTIYIVTTIIFIVPRLLPFDPMTEHLSQLESEGVYISGEDALRLINLFKKRFGLDQPLYVQYVKYLEQVFLHGDLGVSLAWFPLTVQELIIVRLPWSIALLSVSAILAWLGGVLLGALMTWSKKKYFNASAMAVAIFLSKFPPYLIAVVLVYLFIYLIPVFSLGVYQGPLYFSPEIIVKAISQSILPALSIILASLGDYMMVMRSTLINVLGEDYIIFAKAKGLKDGRIMRQYAVKNAILPLLTSLILRLGGTVGGSLLVEGIFGYPGMGTLFWNAVQCNDFLVIQGVTVITTVSTVIASLIIDLLLPIVDPRIQYGGK